MSRTSYWIVAVWAAAFALLFANGAVSYFNLRAVARIDGEVNQSREITRALREVRTSLIDAETGHRGYQITGQTEYLEPFNRANERRQSQFSQLRGHVEADAFYSAILPEFERLIDEKFREMQKSLDIRDEYGPQTAREYIGGNRGKTMMDQIRVLAAEMDKHEDERLAVRTANARERQRFTMLTAILGAIITFVMVALAYTVVRGELQRRTEAEQTVRESESRYRTLTEAIPQMVWNSDAAGRITYVNQRWIDYTGLSANDMTALWWNILVHTEDLPSIDSAWKQCSSANPSPLEVEIRVRRVEDGTYRWFLCTAVPLLRADGRLDQWIGALSSIDEQKRRSEILSSLVKLRTDELEGANSQLRGEVEERKRTEAVANAMSVELKRSNEELEKFAYVASHDLQEPLRKIQSFGDRLATKAKETLDPSALDYVERMKSAATRMRRLIDDLLAFSRVSTKANPFVTVNLNEIVRDVLSDLETRIAQTGGAVDVEPLPTIAGDPTQMQQLFQNIIGNALKFHKPDVPPRVVIRPFSWANLQDDADPPRPLGAGLRIEISDNGIGFDQSYADRVFEVFQRLHGRGEYEGTGIGLAICRKIVQRHHGNVEVRSRVGEGTRFIIDLPEFNLEALSELQGPASDSAADAGK